MGIKVCKFGGTSMADAKAIENVAKIILSDRSRNYVVVSAPGKRFKDDIKITDLLYDCNKEAIETGNCTNSFLKIKVRFLEIVKDLKLNLDLESILNETENQINILKSADFAASRGEYLNAIVMAAKLNFKFIDTADIIIFDKNGNFNADMTNDLTKDMLKKYENAVLPGFYGKDANGNIKTFSRGGSDITGAIVARAVTAEVYENWTDVSGFLACDPRIVENPRKISKLSYKELRELSYMGASVLHSESIFPVRKGKIPINIKNTFKPEDEGTMILPSEMYHKSSNTITGIAGKKDFTVIYIEKSLMNSELGFARRVLSILEQHGISFEHMPSGIDTLSLVIESASLQNGMLDTILEDIKKAVSPTYLRVLDNIALIATVGHGMASSVGTASKLFTALANENINVKLIDQGSSELNIIVGVDNSDYEKCVKAIYKAFI
jgi:aspartate kinase